MLVGEVMKLLSACWSPDRANADGDDGGTGRAGIGREGLLWYKDIGRCVSGDYSMAVVQANQVLEDQSQIESSSGFGTFVGVYDGHGGHRAARYVCDHLYRNLRDILPGEQGQGVSHEAAIEGAFLETEQGFTSLVSDSWDTHPELATVGTCCLVGVICQRTLYVANLGDSRAVLGTKVGNTGHVAAIQLSTEHNADEVAVRQDLLAQHPNDPHIVLLKHGVWRVKGIIQVSRSIGDEYMKHARFNQEPINPKFRISGPMNMPILSANPSIMSHELQQNDLFLIFASDGLWEHLTNDKAVEIVNSHPHMGSAKRLIKAALQEAARKREMRYSDLRRIDKKVRRHFHDDITVIILFINHEIAQKNNLVPPVSIRSDLSH
ncbi:putative Protein phosphatase 2c [Zostera marina]|uniref:protein-serine/threonine phosphatase n=1 Tax=Zostera marina TaxID=29655 RepID=A0A0K9P5Q7_ZOSMR|nr:putative Protein phosphatase 2c [Zostera marina]